MKKLYKTSIIDIEFTGNLFKFKINNDIYFLPKEIFPESVQGEEKQEVQLTVFHSEDTDVLFTPFGKEAEELRKGVEKTIEKIDTNTDPFDVIMDLQKMLDNVDARDSLFYLENKPGLSEVNIFKKSGKWYTDIVVSFKNKHNYLLHDSFKMALREQIKPGDFLDMVAVCSNPNHPDSHPIMIKIEDLWENDGAE